MTFTSLSEISSQQPDAKIYSADPSLPLPTNKIGIELEIEKASYPDNYLTTSGYWRCEQDDSLRGTSIELISTPVFGKDITIALQLVQDYFKSLSKKPVFSDRTSVHIHIECIDMAPDQLVKFLLLYTTLEKILFSFVAPHRKDNIYCLPFYLSEGVKGKTAELIKGLQKKNASSASRSIQNWPKYSAMNVRNISSIGTVEFRALDGTIDAARILVWIKTLMSIKKYAMQNMQSVDDFPKLVSGYSPYDYIVEIFGGELAEQFVNDADLEYNLLAGVRTAQDIIIQAALDKSTNAIMKKHNDVTKSLLYKLYPEKVEVIVEKALTSKYDLSNKLYSWQLGVLGGTVPPPIAPDIEEF